MVRAFIVPASRIWVVNIAEPVILSRFLNIELVTWIFEDKEYIAMPSSYSF